MDKCKRCLHYRRSHRPGYGCMVCAAEESFVGEPWCKVFVEGYVEENG